MSFCKTKHLPFYQGRAKQSARVLPQSQQNSQAQANTTAVEKTGELLAFKMECPKVQPLTKPQASLPSQIQQSSWTLPPNQVEVYCSLAVTTSLHRGDIKASRFCFHSSHPLDSVLARSTVPLLPSHIYLKILLMSSPPWHHQQTKQANVQTSPVGKTTDYKSWKYRNKPNQLEEMMSKLQCKNTLNN